MWVNKYGSSTEIYSKLALKYAQLQEANQQEKNSSFNKVDTIESLAIAPKHLDEQDYLNVLEKYKQLDAQTRTHEQAHASSGLATSSISYNYQMGPDGKLYATGGHVRLDTSIPKDEDAAQAKLSQIQSAATAANELSGADAQIARTASLNKMLLLSQGGRHAN
jgi:hypothetical protein